MANRSVVSPVRHDLRACDNRATETVTVGDAFAAIHYTPAPSHGGGVDHGGGVHLSAGREAVIEYCLDRVTTLFEQQARQAIAVSNNPDLIDHQGNTDDERDFLGAGDGENLLFLLAQAERPPHTRTRRLLDMAQRCSPSFNTSDQRHLTCRLALAGLALCDNDHSHSEEDAKSSTFPMPKEEWDSLRGQLDDAMKDKKWESATIIVVDWWVAAKLRRDDAQMEGVQTAAANYLDQLCRYVAVANQLWQKPPRQAQLKIEEEKRLYLICHLFFVLSDWCREVPRSDVARPHRLRRWLAHMDEVYTLITRHMNPDAPRYALEILVELAMCLRFDWVIYGEQLTALTAQLINMPVRTLQCGFVSMPNKNLAYHGPRYLPIADYHTHCLVAFFLTHSV
jgi:hypothetical protein